MKGKLIRTSLVAILILVLVAFGACGTTTPAPKAELPPIKIGVLRAYTGIISFFGPPMDAALDIRGDEVGWEVAGRKIILVREDESDSPDFAVAKAKKLVEEDKVDIVLGPMLAHSTEAVEAYLKRAGIPHLPWGPSNEATSDWLFTTSLGSGAGDAYPSGLFAYDELGARTAVTVYSDYLFGKQNSQGFKDAFTSRGGKVLEEIAVPFGSADLGSFLPRIKALKPDVISGFLVTPLSTTAYKQYREYGIGDIPVVLASGLMNEEPQLAEIGEDSLGLYSAVFYTPTLDNPDNKAFVTKFVNKTGERPLVAAMQAYEAFDILIEALKTTEGDTNAQKITQALLGLKNHEGPYGTISMSSGRILIHDVYITKVEKVDGRYVNVVVKKYPLVEPSYPSSK